MALLELGGRKFTIPVGDVVLGGDAACTIPLQGAGLLPRHAVLQGLPDGQVVIRKAVAQAEVRINGVRLGAEPTPLLHGDKIEVGRHELTFVDERRSGSTQYLEAMKAPGGVAEAASDTRAGQATASTGGRVVCLTDGREYTVTGSSLVFGRDAGNDVVVPGKDVSRRHCEIIPTPKGYLVVDSSTNGTFVNEQRVQGQRVLGRADIIRIGDEQFRFYADPAPAPRRPEPGTAASESPAAPPSSPAPGAGERLKDTVHGMAAAPRTPEGAGALARFLVKVGDLKGQRLAVRTPVVNIGRADYNDLVLPDASVSTAHAKLQRREGVWVLVDLESTNGTFVDGERVKGEAPLAPGA
ncbi:MAG: FHA domain-containing protein, partial [Gemmatimonadales bacterium]